MQRGRSRCGEFMFVAKTSSGKSNTEMFDDVPVLQRKLAVVEAKYGSSNFEREHYAR